MIVDVEIDAEVAVDTPDVVIEVDVVNAVVDVDPTANRPVLLPTLSSSLSLLPSGSLRGFYFEEERERISYLSRSPNLDRDEEKSRDARD